MTSTCPTARVQLTSQGCKDVTFRVILRQYIYARANPRFRRRPRPRTRTNGTKRRRNHHRWSGLKSMTCDCGTTGAEVVEDSYLCIRSLRVDLTECPTQKDDGLSLKSLTQQERRMPRISGPFSHHPLRCSDETTPPTTPTTRSKEQRTSQKNQPVLQRQHRW